jgi:hypothetical protein
VKFPFFTNSLSPVYVLPFFYGFHRFEIAIICQVKCLTVTHKSFSFELSQQTRGIWLAAIFIPRVAIPIMPFVPDPQAAKGRNITEQPQPAFAVISSHRCTQPAYSSKSTPSTMPTLTRMKARMRALAAASKLPEPQNSSEFPESTTHQQPHSERIPDTAPLKTRIGDRLAAIGACSDRDWTDTEDPIPAIPIPAKSPKDAPATPSDVQDTLLDRTTERYAAAKAFNLGQPSPDTEELAKVCDDIAKNAKQPVIAFSLDGTYVARGVPKGRVARFVETGLLEDEAGTDEEKSLKNKKGGLESSTTPGVETPGTQSEEGDSLAAEQAASVAKASTKSVRGRVWGLWKMTRQGTAGACGGA